LKDDPPETGKTNTARILERMNNAAGGSQMAFNMAKKEGNRPFDRYVRIEAEKAESGVQVTIRVDDLELAAELMEDLAGFLNVRGLSAILIHWY
jgi:hypothetical protein